MSTNYLDHFPAPPPRLIFFVLIKLHKANCAQLLLDPEGITTLVFYRKFINQTEVHWQ